MSSLIFHKPFHFLRHVECNLESSKVTKNSKNLPQNDWAKKNHLYLHNLVSSTLLRYSGHVSLMLSRHHLFKGWCNFWKIPKFRSTTIRSWKYSGKSTRTRNLRDCTPHSCMEAFTGMFWVHQSTLNKSAFLRERVYSKCMPVFIESTP